MLVTTDLHLVDDPAEEYRWGIFDYLHLAVDKYKERTIFILGDITDRKDRHSATLVNNLLQSFVSLRSRGVKITCLLGNHDAPLSGAPYWTILNYLREIDFVTSPIQRDDLWLLPYTSTPNKDWTDINWGDSKAVFMHQTINGAVTENGFLQHTENSPTFPPNVKVYSGDIHVPQKIGNVTYVGAPHPIKFGDNYKCRILRLDEEYEIADEIVLNPPRKMVVNIKTFGDLQKYNFAPGDRIRLKAEILQEYVNDWPELKRNLAQWAQDNSISIASMEADIVLSKAEVKHGDGQLPRTPAEAIAAFAGSQGLADDLASEGMRLLKMYDSEESAKPQAVKATN